MAGKTSMNLGEAIHIALASLWAHKMRTVLTLLGVVIGVSSVIAVVSIVNGLNRYIAEKVFNLGADVFLINRGPTIPLTIEDYEETQRHKKFILDDYQAVLEVCKSCREVGATLNNLNTQTKHGVNYLKDTNLRGWTPSLTRIYDTDLVAGRHITPADMIRSAPVCTVGWDIAEDLLPGEDPIGKEITIDGHPCRVIGVGKKQGSALGVSRDNWVVTPISTFQKYYGTDQSLRIWVKAASAARMQETVDEVRQIVRGRRHLAFGDKDDFRVENAASFLQIWASISSAFFVAMIAIAAISLVVGGIVIMNIMLVSVTERTREIGLRKSIGARQSDILLQFLIESSTIATIGGLWGVFFGVLLAKLVSWVSPLPSAIEAWPMVAGLIVAISVGLFFGIYPASRAARLDPVVALRAE
jgi:putative ABC transport system permease protein